jgi:predicted dehydrogenase
MKRRTFIQQSSLASASLFAGIKSNRQKDKIKIGIVGVGWWGRDFLVHYALNSGEFEIVGICDVNKRATELALAKIEAGGGTRPKVFSDYKSLYDMPDLQAVVIATPTHWHALQFIDACGRGLDIWLEKPISYDLKEAQAMEQAHKRVQNVVLVDFPRIWNPYNAEIKDFIQSGALGEIRQIQFQIHSSTGTAPVSEPHGELDYNAFCGPAPVAPYTTWPDAIGPAWRGQHAFSRGILADWGIHYLQNVREVMDLDLPNNISSIAATINSSNEHPQQQDVLFDFQGLPVQWSHKGWGYVSTSPYTNIGVFYHGSKGTIFSADAGWEVHPGDGSSLKEYGKPKAQYGDPDFLEGVDRVFRDQFQACAGAIRIGDNGGIRGTFAEGFASTATVNLADITMRTGRPLSIDPVNLAVIDNEEAQSQLMRPYRDPFIHPYSS